MENLVALMPCGSASVKSHRDSMINHLYAMIEHFFTYGWDLFQVDSAPDPQRTKPSSITIWHK